MSTYFNYYDAGPLAIDKLRPIQIVTSIGCVVGKFADVDNAKIACEQLNRDKEREKLPTKLDLWEKVHLLNEEKRIYGLDDFTEAYFECALWSEQNEDGMSLDVLYGICDFDPDTFRKMKEDCAKFQKDNLEWIVDEKWLGTKHVNRDAFAQAGHDFWLTRNGHGAGFWDGDWDKDAWDHLTKASKAFGEFSLYVGDDGKLYRSC